MGIDDPKLIVSSLQISRSPPSFSHSFSRCLWPENTNEFTIYITHRTSLHVLTTL